MTSPFQKPGYAIVKWIAKHVPGWGFMSNQMERELAFKHLMVEAIPPLAFNLAAAMYSKLFLIGVVMSGLLIIWVEYDDVHKDPPRWVDLQTRSFGWICGGWPAILILLR